MRSLRDRTCTQSAPVRQLIDRTARCCATEREAPERIPALRAAARAGIGTLVRALRSRAGRGLLGRAEPHELQPVPRSSNQMPSRAGPCRALVNLANCRAERAQRAQRAPRRGRRSNTQPATCFDFIRLRRESRTDQLTFGARARPQASRTPKVPVTHIHHPRPCRQAAAGPRRPGGGRSSGSRAARPRPRTGAPGPWLRGPRAASRRHGCSCS